MLSRIIIAIFCAQRMRQVQIDLKLSIFYMFCDAFEIFVHPHHLNNSFTHEFEEKKSSSGPCKPFKLYLYLRPLLFYLIEPLLF
jgi:hypothetical protein